MKIKRYIAAILAALSIFALTGCQLAREDAGENISEDRLIGVLVTNEYLDLFDVEGYLNNNIKSHSGGEIRMEGNVEQYQGRLYAVLKDQILTNEETGEEQVTQQFVFEGVEGISYFAAYVPATADSESFFTSGSDEAITDGHMGLYYGEEEDKTTLEGTIYVTPNHSDRTCYINPVYQSADGRVFAMSGSGFSVSGVHDEGSAYSQTLDETTTITENGTTKKVSISIKISVAVMLPPEKIVIMQMGKDSAVLSRHEYTPGEVPETLTLETGTAYIIAETYKHDLTDKVIVTRDLLSEKDEILSTFFAREDGVCEKAWTQLIW